jgi:hypothetical protein
MLNSSPAIKTANAANAPKIGHNTKQPSANKANTTNDRPHTPLTGKSLQKEQFYYRTQPLLTEDAAQISVEKR